MIQEKIKDVELASYADKIYYQYGVATLEDRAIPDFRDGLIPVNRRLLWAAYTLGINSKSRFVKSARVVGDTLGRFHPHGDTACYGALVGNTNVGSTINNVCVSLFQGDSNFGSLSNRNYAAMRYCVTGDTWIYTKNHGMVQAKSFLKDKPPVVGKSYELNELYETPSLNGKFEKISHAIYSGLHRVTTVYTDFGPPIKSTVNHPFLVVTSTGFQWVEARHLKPGMVVCSTNQTVDSLISPLSEDEARFIGLLLGDGWVTKNVVGFSNTSNSVTSEYKRLVKLLLDMDPIERTGNTKNKKITSLEVNSLSIRKYLSSKYGIPAGYSAMRSIPKKLFSCNQKVVRAFISGIFECEATVGSQQCWFSNSSKRLLEELQLLIQGFIGVRSTISPDGDNWRLVISGHYQLTSFYSQLQFLSKSRERLRKRFLNKSIAETAGNQKRGCIPFVTKKGTKYEVHTTREKFFSNFENYAPSIKKKYEHHYLGNYVYSTVLKVEKATPKKVPVFDLTVPESHAFTANGYVVHNTELRLSKFTDTILFNKFYTPTIQYGPNYDSSDKEPVVLPALLPVLLINGKFGIATGATTNIPSFEYGSLLKLLRAIFEGEAITDKLLYKYLRYTSTYGGMEKPPVTREEKSLRLASFTDPKGKMRLWSNPTLNGKVITVTKFAISNLEKVLETLNDKKAFPHIKVARDDSSTEDKYGKLTIILYPDAGTKDVDKTFRAVDNLLSYRETFSMNLTERFLDEHGQIAARLSVRPLVKLLFDWVDWRLQLEVKACSHWIEEAAKRIRRFELLILAVDNRKLIIQSLDKDLSAEDLYKWLAKQLKISVEEAKFIYDLKVIQLRKLERQSLVKDMKEVINEKKQLESRKKNPAPAISEQLDSFSQLI